MEDEFSLKDLILSEKRIFRGNGKRIIVDGMEVDLDTPEGKSFVEKTFMNLKSIKDACEVGSSTRHILSQACSRLKKISDSLTDSEKTTPLNDNLNQ